MKQLEMLLIIYFLATAYNIHVSVNKQKHFLEDDSFSILVKVLNKLKNYNKNTFKKNFATWKHYKSYWLNYNPIFIIELWELLPKLVCNNYHLKLNKNQLAGV